MSAPPPADTPAPGSADAPADAGAGDAHAPAAGAEDDRAQAASARAARRARLKRWGERVLFVGGAGLLVWVISRFPLSEVWNACLDLGFGVFLTPLLAMCWFSASTTSLYNLLQKKVPWPALMWNRVVGEGYNALIPAGGVGGEPAKLRQISRYVETQRGVVALINDRLIENGIALGFSAACLGVGFFYIKTTAVLETTMIAYAIGAGAVAIAIGVFVTSRLPGRLSGRIARWLGQPALANHHPPARTVLRSFLWTLLARSLGLCEIGLLYWLLGIHVSVWTIIFTGGALAAAGFIGFAIPQGLGITEAATVGVFQLLHFPGQAGVAFALARRGRALVVSFSGVLLHLIFGRRVAAAELARGRVTSTAAAAEVAAAAEATAPSPESAQPG